MTKYMDYTADSAQFSFDLNKSLLFKLNDQNLINVLGVQHLNTLENASLLDIFLSKGFYVEPHYHQNASELVYCISGEARVTILNPFTRQLINEVITPGMVANVPQGWWHYEEALRDETHLLAIFDAPTPEVILGSDILALTPANVMAETYCIDEKMWKDVTAPIHPGTYIGPACKAERPVSPSYYQPAPIRYV
jgi:quercetin dioxygenase-like cupin family protein